MSSSRDIGAGGHVAEVDHLLAADCPESGGLSNDIRAEKCNHHQDGAKNLLTVGSY